MKRLPLFLSLICSIAADCFFLRTPYELCGVLLFILVQDCHRSFLGIPRRVFLKNAGRIALPLILLCFLVTKKGSLLMAAALSYFCFLLYNVFYAWTHVSKNAPPLFGVCLALLLLCGLHVGLMNQPRFLQTLPLSLRFYCENIASPAIWIFYIPSQLARCLLLLYSLTEYRSGLRQIAG